MLSNVFSRLFIVLVITQVGNFEPYCVNPDGNVECELINDITPGLLNSISNITQAKTFSVIATCPLDILPGAFQPARKLESVHLSYNTIDELRNGTFGNSSIKILAITDNAFGSIASEAFSNLDQLESIELSKNILIVGGSYCGAGSSSRDFPIDQIVLKNLPSLKTLKLTNNKLATIAVHQLVTYPERLELLYLSNNNLTNVTNEMLHRLSNLEVLNLDHNKIAYIEPNSFQQTPKLKILNLYKNNLQELDQNIFPSSGLKQLEDLRLSFNKLMYLSSEFFDRTKKLNQISIAGNPWWCPCLTEIEKVLEMKKIQRILGDFSLYYGIDNKPICVSDKVENKECKKMYSNALSQQFQSTFNV